jgi:hypothetical protein
VLRKVDWYVLNIFCSIYFKMLSLDKLYFFYVSVIIAAINVNVKLMLMLMLSGSVSVRNTVQ